MESLREISEPFRVLLQRVSCYACLNALLWRQSRIQPSDLVFYSSPSPSCQLLQHGPRDPNAWAYPHTQDQWPRCVESETSSMSARHLCRSDRLCPYTRLLF